MPETNSFSSKVEPAKALTVWSKFCCNFRSVPPPPPIFKQVLQLQPNSRMLLQQQEEDRVLLRKCKLFIPRNQHVFLLSLLLRRTHFSQNFMTYIGPRRLFQQSLHGNTPKASLSTNACNVSYDLQCETLWSSASKKLKIIMKRNWGLNRDLCPCCHCEGF